MTSRGFREGAGFPAEAGRSTWLAFWAGRRIWKPEGRVAGCSCCKASWRQGHWDTVLDPAEPGADSTCLAAPSSAPSLPRPGGALSLAFRYPRTPTLPSLSPPVLCPHLTSSPFFSPEFTSPITPETPLVQPTQSIPIRILGNHIAPLTVAVPDPSYNSALAHPAAPHLRFRTSAAKICLTRNCCAHCAPAINTIDYKDIIRLQ